MKNITFLGAGNMAGAIIGGIAGRRDLRISMFDKNSVRYADYEGAGYTFYAAASDAVALADYVFLSVKPQDITELFSMLCNVDVSGKVFVSIMAGVSIARITELLGCDAAVIRTMPNAPLMVKAGVTALTRNTFVSDDDFEFITGIFNSLGETFVIDESHMNAVIGVTSSAPAYVYSFIRGMCDGALEQGFDTEYMLKIICSMVEGSAVMLRKSGKTPGEMIKIVASKGGTTEAALNVLENQGFEGAVRSAMIACTRRAEQLSEM